MFKTTYHSSLAVIAVFLAAATPKPVNAQSAYGPEQVPPGVETASKGPIGDSNRIAGLGFSELTPDAQLSTADGAVSADLSLDYSFAASPVSKDTPLGSVITGSFSNVSIKASIPLNPDKTGSSIDFKNFGNKGKFTLNFNHFAPRFASPAGQGKYFFRFGEACLNEAGAAWIASPQIDNGRVLETAERQAQVKTMLAGYRGEMAGTLLWDEAIEKSSALPKSGAFGKSAAQQCVAGAGHPLQSDTDLARRYAEAALDAQEYKVWRRSIVSVGRTVFYGGDASFGYNRFEIANRQTLLVDRIERVGFDINFHGGIIFAGSSTLVSIGVGYTRAYEPKKVIDQCLPNLSGGCTNLKGQDGLPDRKDTAYAEIGLRKVLLRDRHGDPLVGIAPKITYIREDDAFQVSIPLYFQRSKKGGLDAGVQAIWNSDKKRVAIGAFIGVPFGGF